jgi:hypothetical protein
MPETGGQRRAIGTAFYLSKRCLARPLYKGRNTQTLTPTPTVKHTPQDRRQPGLTGLRDEKQNTETKKAALGGFFYCLVRTERLELSHLAALEPKSSVSTNSTTSALQAFKAKAPDYKSGAFFVRIWGGRWGSNPRQQESQSCALPTELRPPYCVVTLHLTCAKAAFSGAPGRTRTCDHPLRRRMLYPAELRALI